jgi:hypothetical protein
LNVCQKGTVTISFLNVLPEKREGPRVNSIYYVVGIELCGYGRCTGGMLIGTGERSGFSFHLNERESITGSRWIRPL